MDSTTVQGMPAATNGPASSPSPFWRSVFSEPDGTGSSSRVVMAVALAFALGWLTAILAAHLHRQVEPVLAKDQLEGIGTFLAVACAPYGANKVTGIIGNRN